MRTYVRFLVSGALMLLAFAATMVVQGGWQAVLTAVAVFAGAGFLTALISLAATADRLASPAPTLSPGRASMGHAPAAERRREPTPVPTTTGEPPRSGPRARGRLSPVPS